MEKQQKSRHLVLVMLPLQGHITPMLQLATILHSKGFSITILHPEFNSPNPSDHPEFTFVSIPDKLTKSQLSDNDVAGFMQSLNKNCAAPLQQCLNKVLASYGHIAAIIYDTLMFCAQAIADHLRLPGMTLRTSSATTLLFYTVFPELDEKDFISKIESPELEALQLQRFRSLLSHNPTEAMVEVRAAFTNAVMSTSAIIVNSMEFLEQEALSKVKKLVPAPIFTIGPLHKLAPTVCCSLFTEDDKCISWLNNQAPESVIYVSFGSMAGIDKQELIEAAWGLANSELPFLWVVRPGMVGSSEWIELLPNGFRESVGQRACIVQWTPQKQVLAHAAVGGFWSHCGWNSSVESICEGVPMLCKPFFGDQVLNTSYICNVWKIGLELHELERGNVERRIKRVMVDMEGKEMRKRAMELKKDAVVCLMKEGSTSCCLNDLTNQISLSSV
ncbi:UDP-dependent glycosyltransferase 76B1 [Hibiscus trionum]|uniref:UDP-dependent glycosyltransferase 76B1 n=1 Tax=Hibiscus trionum TaxID=183268 RepID=A0A9W7I6K8_HIBTR|nr:UDP-dependent glycosyltransferase 76B1 [Hibiscus trionum]